MLRRHSLNKKVRNSLENPRRSRKLPENHESKALGCPGPLHPRTAELSEAAPNPAPSKTATRAMPQAPQPPPRDGLSLFTGPGRGCREPGEGCTGNPGVPEGSGGARQGGRGGKSCRASSCTARCRRLKYTGVPQQAALWRVR